MGYKSAAPSHAEHLPALLPRVEIIPQDAMHPSIRLSLYLYQESVIFPNLFVLAVLFIVIM